MAEQKVTDTVFIQSAYRANAPKGITMPSSESQAALIRSTYVKAGLDITKESDRPQFFEAHGTGTSQYSLTPEAKTNAAVAELQQAHQLVIRPRLVL
jgi:hypothetical protein